MNVHLNNHLSQLIEPIADAARDSVKVISTEDSLRRIDDYNRLSSQLNTKVTNQYDPNDNTKVTDQYDPNDNTRATNPNPNKSRSKCTCSSPQVKTNTRQKPKKVTIESWLKRDTPTPPPP